MNKFYDNFEQLTLTTKIKDAQDSYYSFEGTIFYGEKGGQLPDKGWINSQSVEDLKWDGGVLYHKVSGELRDPIEMQLDKKTRYINTSVQSAFHLLDGYYDKLGLKLTEVNANPSNQWYEINTKDVDETDLRNVEQWMNDIIQADIPCTFSYVKGSDYPDPTYQKFDQVRLVHFGDINTQPCGTLHVNRTAQIQSFVITGTEPVPNGTRILITTGWVTDEKLQLDEKILKETSTVLSASKDSISEKIQEIVTKNKQLTKQLKAMKMEVLRIKAQELAKSSDSIIQANVTDAGDFNALIPLTMKEVNDEKLVLATLDNKTYFGIISPNGKAREILAKFQEKIEVRGGGSPKAVAANTEATSDEVIKKYEEM
ncbi:hypothetical protein Q2T76_02025 [Lactobacillus sp. YT155]|uniref:hypothetical protein n=1 Tax=Lactobacillus sp. YT155 TaxID=3060955 RepID=UPI00265F90D7|nr:hypothetical protein [Lactobacillus sp. YT155]MDO1604827.1 hypothetical protein [Lactobacillus sp. YT155]